MIYGLLTDPRNDVIEEINSILRLGFDYVELSMEEPNAINHIIESRLYEVKDALSVFDDKAIIHTPPWIDLASAYARVRDAWIYEFKRCIDIASKLDLELINIHARINGLYDNARTDALDNMIDSLRKVIDHANGLSIKVMIENMPKSNSIHKIDEMRYIMNGLDKLYLHLDIAHAYTSDGMKAIINYINTFKDKIKHIHWHDNNGRYDEHLAIGKGSIDHARVARELKRIGYDSSITLEVFSSKYEAKESADKLSYIIAKA